MKKLLLVSLLALGATSFAAVTGTEAQTEMPIKVRGNVIDKTGTNLVIEPIKNAGVDGASMEFDFGALVQGEKQSLEGTFAVYRSNKSPIGEAANISVGMLDATGKAITQTAETTDAGGKKGITVGYTVNSALNGDKTRINGTVGVNVNVDAATPTGEFLDITQKLAVIVGAKAPARL